VSTDAVSSGFDVGAWLREHPEPSGEELARAGLVAPHWPPPWGLGADAATARAIDEELAAAGVVLPDNPIGIGWAGPTLLVAGTDAQRDRHLFPILSGAEVWCQLFSEPDAGSDLAALRTRAEPDGDGWRVSGHKVWSTSADVASFGILLARTDPDVPRHRGISYFICPMDAAGIEVRPIREMTGGSHFNEVFLDGVHLGPEHLVGRPGDGWRLARVTLGNERVSLSSGGILWGMGPTGAEVLALARAVGVTDPVLRQEVARCHTEAFLLDLLSQRAREAVVAGGDPGPVASLKKLLADEHGQRLMELVARLAGADAVVASGHPWPSTLAHHPAPVGGGLGAAHQGTWPWSYLFARALTIGGGTTQVQRNIIAEQLLGLPREPVGGDR
jgi:alkylation response protein AidB-like acyl-CoA dehydrogenase